MFFFFGEISSNFDLENMTSTYTKKIHEKNWPKFARFYAKQLLSFNEAKKSPKVVMCKVMAWEGITTLWSHGGVWSPRCKTIISSGAQDTTLQKYFSHPSLVIYFFFNPTHKTETGPANKRGTTNSEPSGPITYSKGRREASFHPSVPSSIRQQQSDHIYYTLLCRCTALHCSAFYQPPQQCFFLCFKICSTSGKGMWQGEAFMAICKNIQCDVGGYTTTPKKVKCKLGK